MKRPLQHIIENKSKKLLNDIIPDEWVSRELGDDYGYDYLVEIFEENQSTGKTFYVQLKGSNQKIRNNEIKVQINVDNIEYFNKTLQPVLLVFCSTITNQIWAIWANDILNTLEIKKNQATKLIKLSKNNIIDSKYFYELSSMFTIDFTANINIYSDLKDNLCKQYYKKLSKYLNHFYGRKIVFNNHTLPKSLVISFKMTEGKIKISVSFNQIKRVLTISSYNILESSIKPIINFNTIEENFKEILSVIAIILVEANTAGTLEILKNTIEKFTFSEYSFSDLLNIGRVAVEKREFFRFQNLIEESIKMKKFDVFNSLNLAYFLNHSNKENIKKNYQNNIIKAIESWDETFSKGLQYYNLANSLSENQHKEAIKYYFLARKNNPSYTEKYYWWREIASQFFFTGHFKLAEDFYKKCLKIMDDNSVMLDPIIHALIGDCLFYQCRFAKAKVELNIFFNKSEMHLSEWILKEHICNFFINNDLDCRVTNSSESKNAVQHALKKLSNGEDKDAVNLFIEAIKKMPSNNSAWFNYAIIMSENKVFDQALNSFLIAALFADGDKEAWINSLFLAFYLKKDYLLCEILNAINHKYGNSIKQEISDFIFKQEQMSFDERKKFYNAIETLYDSITDSGKLD